MNTVSDRLASATRERLALALEEDQVPGAAVGLIVDGTEHHVTAGITNMAHPLPVTPTTMFQIASVSKIFTALTAVRLAERRVLSLTEPIRTYLPDLKLSDEACARVLTLEDLLCHRAGWPGDFDVDTGRGDDALARLSEAWAAAPQWAPVGTTFSYSNLGFGLAGHVIATAAGEPFETVVTREVSEPLGLRRTAYFLEDLAFERWTGGHRRSDGGIELAPWWRPRSRGPNGGVLSCIEDLMTFAHFHLGDGTSRTGERLLSREALFDMRRPRTVDTVDTSVGLGWMLQRWETVDAVTHYGSTYGYATALVLFPGVNAAVGVLTNANYGGVIDAILATALAELFGVTVSEPHSCGLDDSERAEIEGVYGGQNGCIKVVANDGRLEARIFSDPVAARGSGDPLRSIHLVPVARDALGYAGASLASRYSTVVRDENGRIAFLRVSRRLFRRLADE